MVGRPDEIFTDNGPLYTGQSFKAFTAFILEWTTSLDTSSRTLFVREDVSPDVHVTSNVELRNNLRLLLNVETYVISRQIVI